MNDTATTSTSSCSSSSCCSISHDDQTAMKLTPRGNATTMLLVDGGTVDAVDDAVDDDEQVTIDDLPNELIVLIFAQLPPYLDIATLCRVCSRWRSLLSITSTWTLLWREWFTSKAYENVLIEASTNKTTAKTDAKSENDNADDNDNDSDDDDDDEATARHAEEAQGRLVHEMRVTFVQTMRAYLSRRATVERVIEWAVSRSYEALLRRHIHDYMRYSPESFENKQRTVSRAAALACDHADVSLLQQLLAYGASVNVAQGSSGFTPLIMASDRGYYTVVQQLLALKADPERRSSAGLSPLIVAAWNGHHSVVTALLRAAADPNTANVKGTSPLYAASELGHAGVVDALLSAPRIKLDQPRPSGATPLYIAAQKGHIDIVRRLLDAGASVNARLFDGGTPLFIACKKGHTRVAQMLLERHAHVNAATELGTSPLMAAVEGGHMELVGHLICAKANVNQLRPDGLSTLTVATSKAPRVCMPQLVDLLLDANASIDTWDLASAKRFAKNNGRSELLDILQSFNTAAQAPSPSSTH